MKKTTFATLLASVDLPFHVPTFRAALEGWPTKKYAMKPEEAMRIARMAMWSMLLREYQWT